MDLLINLDVDDLQKGIDFYVQSFGLSLARRLYGGTVAELTGAPVKLYLLEKPAGSVTAGQHRAYRRHWTPVHLDFVVADIEAALQRAVTAGARLEGSVSRTAARDMATLSDPFGHGFCLLQFHAAPYVDGESPAAG